MLRFGLIAFVFAMMVSGCTHFETQDAVLVHDLEPTYPEQARREGIEGRVIVEYVINEQGVPVDLQIVEATPRGFFESAALAAVSEWRYKPALKYGKPVRSPEAEAVLKFKLNKTDETG